MLLLINVSSRFPRRLGYYASVTTPLDQQPERGKIFTAAHGAHHLSPGGQPSARCEGAPLREDRSTPNAQLLTAIFDILA